MAFRSDTNGLETNLADTTGGYGLLFRENPKRQWMRLHYKSTIFRTVASDYPSVTISLIPQHYNLTLFISS